jgi:hypothetical protein
VTSSGRRADRPLCYDFHFSGTSIKRFNIRVSDREGRSKDVLEQAEVLSEGWAVVGGPFEEETGNRL